MTGYCQDVGFESHEQVLLVACTVDTRLLQDDETFKPALDPTQVRILFFLIHSQTHFSQVDDMDDISPTSLKIPARTAENRYLVH